MSNIIPFEIIKNLVPSVFTKSASPKMSEKYIFVPTDEILEKFFQENWQVSQAKQVGKGLYGVHEIRLRNSEMPQVGDSLIEAIIRNSHNGLSTFSIRAGLHRLVCSNGLTIPTSISESINFRHQSFDLGEVRRLTDSFAEKIPMIQKSMDKMKSRELSDSERIGFVKQASSIRWKENKTPIISPEEILKPMRDEDNGKDMWTTFNVVQEKFVRGGVGYTSGKRLTKMKELTNIVSRNKVNTELWELADSYC